MLSPYLSLRASADFFSPHLVCLAGITPAGLIFALHYGVPPDTPEDPFTGSATGGMGAYLWRYGLIEQPEFLAEQSHWMDRPGQAWVQAAGSPQDIETMQVGGPAVAVLQGDLSVPVSARPGTRRV